MGQFKMFSTHEEDQNEQDSDKDGLSHEEEERMQQQLEIVSDDEDENDNSDVDFAKICEYQHKILRKYTMLGMISYSDAPQFHTLVE